MSDLESLLTRFEAGTAAQISALNLCGYLALAGVLCLYLRLLYRKCAVSPSNTDGISRVFPLLALITTGVIAVVKSSLALSLGLVGALSIVRFRAAIKEPEELVYLFLCIAIGLALGAEQPLLALSLTAVSTLFIVGMHLMSGGQRRQRLLLTIIGNTDEHFTDSETGAIQVVEAVAGKFTLQRFDVENDRAQLRLVLRKSSPSETVKLVNSLRQKLPGCDISYVDLNSTL